MRDPGDVAVSLASLEEGGFSWVSPQLLQAADVAGKKKKKKKLGVTQDQVLGLQRAQAHYRPPARGALVPFCEDRQRGSAFWRLSAAPPTQSIWEGRPLRRCCKEV